MKKTFKPLLLILAVSLVGCDNSSSENNVLENMDALLLTAGLYQLHQTPAGNQDYLNRSSTGLSAWSIGLNANNFGTERNIDTNYELNPPNWITVAGDTCDARGVPANITGSNCVLSGNVIGVCFTRFLTAGTPGRIIDTTLLIRSSFQQDSTVSDSDKQSVFTHEIGHCLGLRHAQSGLASTCGGSYLNCIMFPSVSGADTPHAQEITAIQSAYSPAVQDPSSTDRYNTCTSGSCSGEATRHWSFPLFTISASIGNALVYEPQAHPNGMPPGTPLNPDNVITIAHLLKDDGSEEVRIYDANFLPLPGF
ncbi:MAG: hypothetical protein KDK30_09155 [Leptospiraceae bacterium]|nr:hypothetical protein [Leptospiraceae bacterium]